jgi:DNA-binding transcriptional LysR family regulator
MLDRLTSLRVFIEVAASGSLSGAARKLNMSQTMATKHIAALEQHLGVKLFHRSTRRLSLTEPGRNYLESSERILTELDAADSAVSAARFEPRGTLRVSAPVSFGSRQIAPLVNELTRRHPNLLVELGLNDRQVDLADEGWDLAVRIGTLESSNLIARKLAPCRTVVAASPAYLKAHGTPKKAAELSRHNCLGYTLSRMAGVDRWPFGLKGETFVSIRGNLSSNNGDALRAAAVAGQGIIYQPTFIVGDDLRAGTLVALHLDRPTYEFGGIHAVYLPDRNPPAKLRVFIDFLAERFGSRPPWDELYRGRKVMEKCN